MNRAAKNEDGNKGSSGCAREKDDKNEDEIIKACRADAREKDGKDGDDDNKGLQGWRE